MAKRSRLSQQKRQRELRKAEKAAEKRAKRHGKASEASDAFDGDENSEEVEVALPASESTEPSLSGSAADASDLELTSASSSSPSDAATVQAYCKVCRVVAAHSVVESKGAKPRRVCCAACQDVHPYRKTKPAPRKRPATPKVSEEVGYDALMQGRDLSLAKTYAVTQRFDDKDVIDHAVFGFGLVTRVLEDRKIEVWFREGQKLLAHAR